GVDTEQAGGGATRGHHRLVGYLELAQHHVCARGVDLIGDQGGVGAGDDHDLVLPSLVDRDQGSSGRSGRGDQAGEVNVGIPKQGEGGVGFRVVSHRPEQGDGGAGPGGGQGLVGPLPARVAGQVGGEHGLARPGQTRAGGDQVEVDASDDCDRWHPGRRVTHGGRPRVTAMSADPKVIDALERAEIPYEIMDCDPDLADTAAFCEAYGVDPGETANTILVATRRPAGHHAACVALATTKVDVNGTVRRRLGVKKVSFAPADLTVELTGMEIGGVTPPGLPDGIPIWVDQAVVGVESAVIGAGTRSAKIRLRGADMARRPGAEVVPGLAVPLA